MNVKSMGLLAASWALFLCIGAMIGYVAFSGKGGEAQLNPAIPENPPPNPGGRIKEPADAAPIEGDGETVRLLKERIEVLERQLSDSGKAEPAPEGGGSSSRGPETASTPERSGRRPWNSPPAGPPENLPRPRLNEGLGGIEGYVLDSGGLPSRDVKVSARNEESDVLRTADTDSSGFYRFADIQPGSYWMECTGGKDGLETWPVKEIWVPEGEFLRADFGGSSCAVVGGFVSDADGKPVAGAVLSILRLVRAGEVNRQKVVTDSQGRFRLGLVEQGRYSWNLAIEGQKDSLGSGNFDADRSGPLEWDIRLDATGIAGLIVDAGTGSPATGAEIVLWPKGGGKGFGYLPKTRTDTGEFRIQNIEPGSYQIKVYCPGRAYFIGEIVRIEKGKMLSGVEIALVRAARVRLILKTESAEPVKEIDLRWTRDGNEVNYYLGRSAREDGSFLVDDVGPGVYTLTIMAPGHLNAAKTDVRLSDGPNPDIVFELEKE